MNNPVSFFKGRKFSTRNKVHFFINICIGCLIAIIFHFIEYTDRGENAINYGLDLFIKHEAKKALNKIDPSEQLLFLDIDHDTYQKWGEPLITPRDKIAEMIEYACRGNANIIGLDILLEDRDCCNEDGDKRLRNLLDQMTKEKSPVKIIFSVSVKHNGKIKENLFDGLIDKNPNFYRATPSGSATSTDLRIRYWAPFTIAKANKAGDIVLWGFPLLTALLAEEKIDGLKKIEKKILKNNNSKDKNKFKYEINIRKKNIMIKIIQYEDVYSQRIRFFLIPSGPYQKVGNLLKSRLKVAHLKEPNKVAHKKTFYDQFKGKIVIIGNSSPDAGDIRPTPIGDMPGMYIIGNAIYTIINGLHLKRTSLWINIITEIIAIIVAAYFFMSFSSFLAKILVTIVALLLLVPISWCVFVVYGVYFNFVLPITGIGLYEMVRSIEESFISKGIKNDL